MDEPITWLDINGDATTFTKVELKELIGLMVAQRGSGYFQEASFIKQIKAVNIVIDSEDPDDDVDLGSALALLDAINIIFS